jgi:hypothetical protein
MHTIFPSETKDSFGLLCPGACLVCYTALCTIHECTLYVLDGEISQHCI